MSESSCWFETRGGPWRAGSTASGAPATGTARTPPGCAKTSSQTTRPSSVCQLCTRADTSEPDRTFGELQITRMLISCRVFRYEDFSMDPYNNTKEIFEFFGFTFHKKVEQFLDTHTKTNIGGVSSTFRDSKTAPFKWREKLSKDEVLEIQVGTK